MAVFINNFASCFAFLNIFLPHLLWKSNSCLKSSCCLFLYRTFFPLFLLCWASSPLSYCTVTKYFNSSRSHREERRKCGLSEKAMTSQYYDYPQFMELKCSWNQFCYWIYLNFFFIFFISSFLSYFLFLFPLPSYFVAI